MIEVREIEAARARIADVAVRTPLVRLHAAELPAETEIYLKLEILEDLPDPDAVVIPFGGGGLTGGIASAIRAMQPDTQIYTAEPVTGAALAGALKAGEPVEVGYTASFVDGSGSRRVLDAMWPRVRPLVDGAFVVPIAEAAAAVRLLATRANVVAEGAGALATAAALAGQAGTGKVVCIVSGGNIDPAKLAEILRGGDS